MRRVHTLSLALPLVLAGIAGCGDSSSDSTPAISLDASAMLDASTEAGEEASIQDAPPDAPPGDATLDAAADAPPDAPDASPCPPLDNPQWSLETVDDTPGFKARVAAAVDPLGGLRLAYNVATSADGWSEFELRVAESTPQGYVVESVVPSEGFSNEFPTLAVDAAGDSHVVYNRFVPAENQIDLFLVSGTVDGGFSAPVNLTSTPDSDENGGAVAVGPDGTLHVVHMSRKPIPDKPGKYTYQTGYVAYDDEGPRDASTLAVDTLPFTGEPEQSITVDQDGNVHVVYLRPGEDPSHGVAYYRRKDAGGWGDEVAVTSNLDNATGISIAVTPDGVTHFAYGKGKVDIGMTYRTYEAGTLGPEQALTSSAQDRAYYLGLGAVGAQGIYVAYRRLVGTNADVLFTASTPEGFAAEEWVTETPAEDEQVSSLATGPCGEAYVAFVENLSTAPDGRVRVAARR